MTFILLVVGSAMFLFGAMVNVIAFSFHDRKQTNFGGVVAIIGLVLLTTAFILPYTQPKPPKYEYTVKAYYLGGSQRQIKVTAGDNGPQIYSNRGSYTLVADDVIEQGVVRFEVISKRPITER